MKSDFTEDDLPEDLEFPIEITKEEAVRMMNGEELVILLRERSDVTADTITCAVYTRGTYGQEFQEAFPELAINGKTFEL